MTLATSPGYLRYPPPTVYLADAHSGYRSNLAHELPITSLPFFMWPSVGRGEGRTSLHQTDDANSTSAQERLDTSASVRLLTYSTPSGQYELLLSPIETSNSPVPEEPQSNMEHDAAPPVIDAMETELQPEERNNQFLPLVDSTHWELPFLQGWLIGQSQAGQQAPRGGAAENLPTLSGIENNASTVPSVMPTNHDQSRGSGRSGSQHRSSAPRMISATGFSDDAPLNNENVTQPSVSRIQSEIATSLAAAAAAELPCTVKLRIWPHDVKEPCATLDSERCRLTIPHAVLCR